MCAELFSERLPRTPATRVVFSSEAGAGVVRLRHLRQCKTARRAMSPSATLFCIARTLMSCCGNRSLSCRPALSASIKRRCPDFVRPSICRTKQSCCAAIPFFMTPSMVVPNTDDEALPGRYFRCWSIACWCVVNWPHLVQSLEKTILLQIRHHRVDERLHCRTHTVHCNAAAKSFDPCSLTSWSIFASVAAISLPTILLRCATGLSR
jgi:hypothetical protein